VLLWQLFFMALMAWVLYYAITLYVDLPARIAVQVRRPPPVACPLWHRRVAHPCTGAGALLVLCGADCGGGRVRGGGHVLGRPHPRAARMYVGRFGGTRRLRRFPSFTAVAAVRRTALGFVYFFVLRNAYLYLLAYGYWPVAAVVPPTSSAAVGA
jgi:hypothetical protein